MCGRAKLSDDVSEIKIDLKIDWTRSAITGRAGTPPRHPDCPSSFRNVANAR
jgi:hypothetical protein